MSGPATNSATTLFNLKDEYLKAKQASRPGTTEAQGPSKQRKLKDIINYRKEAKDAKQAARAAREQKRAARLAMTAEEEAALARSRSTLEAKTAAYDKLIRDSNREASETVLVDFSSKRSEGQDQVAIAYDYANPDPTSRYSRDDLEEGMEDGAAEVHFANVDHAEVRSKGVGFYNFSEDPEVRAQQMEFLNSMRDSTERSRELFEVAKSRRREEKLERLNRLQKALGMSPPLERLPREKEEEEVEGEERGLEGLEEEAARVRKEEEEKRRQTRIEERFLTKEKTLWEKKVEELRDEREMDFAPVYQKNAPAPDKRYQNFRPASNVGQNSGSWVGNETGTAAGSHYDLTQDEEELGEEDDAIVNFISHVRYNT